jgi:phospholipid/cholesterol/gamma-HCH transport system substrate-binding protein
MRKKDHNNLLRVGAFVTGLTIMLMVLIISIGKENSIFESKIDLKARVENVSNLKPGSYVELKGIRVGTVSNIAIISGEEVEITITILASHLKWIKKDSKVSVSTAGLVGDKFLEIYDGTKDAPTFDPKHDFLVAESVADFKKILTKGESIATITERILNKVDHLLTNIEDGKTIVKTINSFQKSSENLEKITNELREANIAKTVNNINSSMNKLDKTTASMERIMLRVEKGPGTVNSLIYDDGLHDDLRALLGGAQRNKVIKYFIRESIQNSERKKSKTDD